MKLDSWGQLPRGERDRRAGRARKEGSEGRKKGRKKGRKEGLEFAYFVTIHDLSSAYLSVNALLVNSLVFMSPHVLSICASSCD